MLPSANIYAAPTLCRVRRHLACARPLHPRQRALCAAFVGTQNSKTCPQSYSQVETEAACRSLAAIGGKSYVGNVNLTSSPPGCFWLNVGGGVYLNTNANGAAHRNAQQLCAGAAARPPRRRMLGEAQTPQDTHRHAHRHSHTSDFQRFAGPNALVPTFSPSHGTAARCCMSHGPSDAALHPSRCSGVWNSVQHSRSAAQTATAARKSILGSRPRRRARAWRPSPA